VLTLSDDELAHAINLQHRVRKAGVHRLRVSDANPRPSILFGVIAVTDPTGPILDVATIRPTEVQRHNATGSSGHQHAYAQVVELGGFQVSGPCAVDEITRRFGPGAFRISAYGFEPAGLRWEVLVDALAS